MSGEAGDPILSLTKLFLGELILDGPKAFLETLKGLFGTADRRASAGFLVCFDGRHRAVG
jgi:hypothetical protein